MSDPEKGEVPVKEPGEPSEASQPEEQTKKKREYKDFGHEEEKATRTSPRRRPQ